jgi:DNA-binding response OmpR family regulator
VTLGTLPDRPIEGVHRVGAILRIGKGAQLATIGVLIIDNDEASQSAMRQMLDSEGWLVQVVPELVHGLAELSTGEWSLVIANVATTGLTGPLFSTLKELALAPAIEDGKMRARVLFLVPEPMATEAPAILERERLQYLPRPFHYQDVIEKVSDLLMETAALSSPIRQVDHDSKTSKKGQEGNRLLHEFGNRPAKRNTGMFANRSDYTMTEEEISEYEKTEKLEEEQKKKKKLPQR